MDFDSLHSCIYTGNLRHRRFKPVENHFSYPIFMLYLDLDELDQVVKAKWFISVNRHNIASFWTKDYFGSPHLSAVKPSKPQTVRDEAASIKQNVIDHVLSDAKKSGVESPQIHSVRLLTHVRYANVIFNPVSFYYCYDADENLVAILSEITNTPWGERYPYVHHIGYSSEQMSYSPRSAKVHRFGFEKDFHVSPFNPMNMDYDWSFSEPGKRLHVHMNNFLQGASEEESKHFDATLVMEKKSIAQLGHTLIRYPLMCVSVVTGIYWQAFKLWVKRSPFYDHPQSIQTDTENNDKPDTQASQTHSLSPKRGISS